MPDLAPLFHARHEHRVRSNVRTFLRWFASGRFAAFHRRQFALQHFLGTEDRAAKLRRILNRRSFLPRHWPPPARLLNTLSRRRAPGGGEPTASVRSAPRESGP